MSVEDMRELARSNREDPIRVFSDACREETEGVASRGLTAIAAACSKVYAV